jgi:putative transposase
VYRSSTSKKKEDFLEFLYQLRHKEKRKRIVLVLDNARIHHAKIIKKYCEEHNIKLVYLPPYSPELNPIEFLWKRIKRMYQKIQRKYDQIVR